MPPICAEGRRQACQCSDQVETFWSLLTNAAHWEFKLFLMLLVDGLLLGLLYPKLVKLRTHLKHHTCPPEGDADACPSKEEKQDVSDQQG
jgi:hypothetical protein